MGIARIASSSASVPAVRVLDGVELRPDARLVNLAETDEPLAVTGATFCEFAELVLGQRLGLPTSCTASGGSVSMFSGAIGATADLGLAVRALRAAGAVVTVEGGTVNVSGGDDDGENREPATAVETADGSLLLADGELIETEAQDVARIFAEFPGAVVHRVAVDPDTARQTVGALGLPVAVAGLDELAFIVGPVESVRVAVSSLNGHGRAGATIPLASFDEAMAELLRVGSVRFAHDPAAQVLRVTGPPEDVAEVVRLARGVLDMPRDRSLRVAFVTGRAENVARAAAEVGAVLDAGGGLLRFGSSTADFDVILSALQSSRHLRTDDRPSIRVVDGRPASVSVGVSVPVILGVDEEGRQEVEYREAGTLLRVQTAPVWPGSVSVQIEAEVSQVEGTGVLDNPNFSRRAVSTVARMRPGEVVILSGFLGQSDAASRLLGLEIFGRESLRSRTEMHLMIAVH